MVDSFGFLSLLPPLVAIGLAIGSRQVYLSLAVGVWLGWTLLSGWDPLSGLVRGVDAVVEIFADGERTRILMVSIMIGALLTFTQYSGGMSGFVNWVVGKGWVSSRRSAGIMAWALGFFIFVESVIGVLVSGTITRPLFDRLRISREKLSYILDSTCAPKATLLPLNTWGAFIIGLLLAQEVDHPVGAMFASIPFNFYCILAIGLALIVASGKWDLGPMREAERRVRDEGKPLRDGAEPLVATEALMIQPKLGVPLRAFNMIAPIGAVLVALPGILWITGEGDLMEGSGTLAAFWAVLIGLGVGAILYRVQGILSLNESTDMFMKGVGALIPVGVLLLLAFAIGDVCRELGTGTYVAAVAQVGLTPAVVPAALFLVASIVAFSTGTSFGTWAIMIPIAIPMVSLMNLHPSLTIASVLGGGIFGDHCSPISDSTIISSMAAGTDHIDHVRTQLPYALAAAGASTLLYLSFGFAL